MDIQEKLKNAESALSAYIKADKENMQLIESLRTKLTTLEVEKAKLSNSDGYAEPSTNYIQPVPDHCDRIIHKNRYYSIELLKDAPTPDGDRLDAMRCKVTGNPCGTDTRMKGFPCLCANCQAITNKEDK